MELKEAIRILNWNQSQMRLGNLPDYSQNVYQSIETVLQELDRLQKENEELKKRFKRYGDVDLVKLAQIKEIEESVPKFYIDKKTYENLLKEE